MVDLSVEASLDAQAQRVGIWGPYYSGDDGVIVFADSGANISFTRTTDAGATWTRTQIESNDTHNIACYYDQENPGDSGTLVHVVFLDRDGEDAHYLTVDVSDGSQGALRLVDDGITVNGDPQLNRAAIAKARNGNLMIAFATQTEIECYTSDDSGATWTDRNNVFESPSAEDWALLFPANVDDGDFAALFWDRSAVAITVKMFDESAGTWTESALLSGMLADLSHINMDAVTRHSDGFILGCAHSDEDTSGDDLRTFTVNPNSIASPTIVTSTANIFTNQGESGQCAIHINQQNDDVRVAYLKGGTWLSSVDCVYHLSTDGMTSWAVESAYTEDTADDLRFVQAGRTTGDDGGYFQPVVFNHDLTELFVNRNNDVEILATGAGVQSLLPPRGRVLNQFIAA